VKPDPIIDLLPHRPPFRFISFVENLSAGVSGEGVWTIRGDEPFFQGHFPGEPVVPGVLITEALAQLSGLVGVHAGLADGPPPRGRLAHTDIRFDSAVVPPAEVRLRTSVTRSLGSLVQFEVSASVSEQVVARGSLAIKITDGLARERS
jgi:3-hydroxyacyl-[acyl-carrier-protein] dehydratase